MTTTAIQCTDLWFSYEVAQNTSATAKSLEATKENAKSLRTSDGGLSVDAPRKQHDAGTEIVYKVSSIARSGLRREASRKKGRGHCAPLPPRFDAQCVDRVSHVCSSSWQA